VRPVPQRDEKVISSKLRNWSVGVEEYRKNRNTGVLEHWSIGRKKGNSGGGKIGGGSKIKSFRWFSFASRIPILQYSDTPLLPMPLVTRMSLFLKEVNQW